MDMEDITLNDWVFCPYDPNHKMKYSKFHNHFVKCQKNHPEDPRIQCPYYASELIHPDDMNEHLLTCKYKFLYPTNQLTNVELPVYDAPCHFNFDESSEEEDLETIVSVPRTENSSLFSSATSIKGALNSIHFKRRDEVSEVGSSDLEFNIKDDAKNVMKKKKIIQVFKNDENSDYIVNPSIGTKSTTNSEKSFELGSRKLGLGRAMIMKHLLAPQANEKKGLGHSKLVM